MQPKIKVLLYFGASVNFSKSVKKIVGGVTNLKFSFLFNDLFYPKSLKTPKCPKNVTILGTLDFLVFVTGVLLLFVAFLGHRSGHLNRLPKMPIILES